MNRLERGTERAGKNTHETKKPWSVSDIPNVTTSDDVRWRLLLSENTKQFFVVTDGQKKTRDLLFDIMRRVGGAVSEYIPDNSMVVIGNTDLDTSLIRFVGIIFVRPMASIDKIALAWNFAPIATDMIEVLLPPLSGVWQTMRIADRSALATATVAMLSRDIRDIAEHLVVWKIPENTGADDTEAPK